MGNRADSPRPRPTAAHASANAPRRAALKAGGATLRPGRQEPRGSRALGVHRPTAPPGFMTIFGSPTPCPQSPCLLALLLSRPHELPNTLYLCLSLGVILWRLQLGAKRRFEVAEQTLTAFQRASDGLSRLRDRFIYTGELAVAESAQGATMKMKRLPAQGGQARGGARPPTQRVRRTRRCHLRLRSGTCEPRNLGRYLLSVGGRRRRQWTSSFEPVSRCMWLLTACTAPCGSILIMNSLLRRRFRPNRLRDVALSRNIAEHRDTETGKPDDTDVLVAADR